MAALPWRIHRSLEFFVRTKAGSVSARERGRAGNQPIPPVPGSSPAAALYGRSRIGATLSVCISDEAFPPFTFPDREGSSQQLIRQAAERQGWRVNFVPQPWRRCLAGVDGGGGGFVQWRRRGFGNVRISSLYGVALERRIRYAPWVSPAWCSIVRRTAPPGGIAGPLRRGTDLSRDRAAIL
ncbi:hypothetical protein FBY03_12347 [Pseudomonas sp. SJZ079]|nr:hypothetical protein FBY03_12347 [Pseudomonas sp. SJZ079]